MNIEIPQQESTINYRNPEPLDIAIRNALSYLKDHQYPYGEFCSYYAPDDAMNEWTIPCSTIFTTALIVNCLLPFSDNAEVKHIFRKATSFFQYQVMRGGAMNFLTKWNQYFSISPADIDDTIFVANFFQKQKIEFPDPYPILLANRAKNQLFYTWFTLRFTKSANKNYWLLLLRELKSPIGTFIFWRRYQGSRNDIDAVVNANVLYYLGKSEITEPIINHLLKIIKENKEHDCDKWYRNPLTFYYFYSKNVSKGVAELASVSAEIIDRISNYKKENGCIGSSALETALSISTLINLKYRGALVTDAVEFLLNTQQPRGGWPRFILYYSGPKKEVGWGSEELTTAFCIEALNLFKTKVKHENNRPI